MFCEKENPNGRDRMAFGKGLRSIHMNELIWSDFVIPATNCGAKKVVGCVSRGIGH